MIKRTLLILIAGSISLSAIASSVNIIIKNKSNEDATIIADKNAQNWNCGDLCVAQTVKANTIEKFRTDTSALNKLISKYTGIQTINITYGQTIAQVQIWVDHEHSVDTNIKSAVIKAYFPFMSDGKYMSLASIGVGTNIDSISTDLYVENIGYDPGTPNITLILT